MKKIILTTLAAMTMAQPLFAKELFCGVLQRTTGKSDYTYNLVMQINQTVGEGESVILRNPTTNKVAKVAGQIFYVSSIGSQLAMSIAPNVNQVQQSMVIGEAQGKQLSLFKNQLILTCLVR